MSVAVFVNTTQKRLGYNSTTSTTGESQSLLVTGYDWDLSVLSSDLYVDPTTGTLMCRPALLYPAWLTSNSGIYSKLPGADFTPFVGMGSVPTTYTQSPNADGSQFYYVPNNTTTGGIGGYGNTTAATPGVNQAMVFGMFIDQTTPNTSGSMWFGYSNQAGFNSSAPWLSTGSTGVPGSIAIKFYFNGGAEVWYNNVLVGSYTFSGTQKDRFNKNLAKQGDAKQGKYMAFAIIPCRQRELLVISSEGTAFTHVFDEIPEGTTNATITPSGPAWFWADNGVTLNCQVAICQYGPGGNAYSVPAFWRYDPGTNPPGGSFGGTVLPAGFQFWVDGLENTGIGENISGSLGGTYGNCVDAITITNPYANNTNGVRIGMALTGGTSADGFATSPFLFGVRAFTVPQLTSIGGVSFEVTNWVDTSGFELNASDNSQGLTGKLKLFDIQGLSAAMSSAGFGQNISVLSGMSCQVLDDGVVVFDGVMISPKNTVGVVQGTGRADYIDGSTHENRNEAVEFELRDKMYLLEEYVFGDPIPFDGLGLQTAFIEAAELGGADSASGQLHISNFGGYTLESTGNVTDGEYNVMVRPGDKCAGTLDRFVKSYVANAFIGYHPSVGLQILAQSDLPTTSVATLYDSLATQIAHGQDPDPDLLFKLEDFQVLSPLANDLNIMGFDVRTRRPIWIHQANLASADPGILPALRPNNWLGFIRRFGQVEPRITSQTVGQNAIAFLYPSYTAVRGLIQFNAQAQPALQRGQVVELQFLTSGLPYSIQQFAPGISGITGTTVKARIKTFSARYTQLGGTDTRTGLAMKPWKRCSYVAQILDGASDGSLLSVSSRHAAGIVSEWTNRVARNQQAFFNEFVKEIHKRPSIIQVEI